MAMAACCIWLSKITGGDPAITLWHMPSQIGKVQTASPKLYTFKLQSRRIAQQSLSEVERSVAIMVFGFGHNGEGAA